MNLPCAPAQPRSCLNQVRSATTPPELDAMRRAAWRSQGVVSLHVEDIVDPWLRQAVTNEAVRRWGRRKEGTQHGQ